METLVDPAEVLAIKERIARLHPESAPLWGRMSVDQMLVHNVRSMELALGDAVAPRMFLGRLIGRFIKPMALKDGVPMRRNSPTLPTLLVTDSCEFEGARTKLLALIDRFAAEAEAGGNRMHAFFGMLTPQELSKLAHKHLDHHLRQFGV